MRLAHLVGICIRVLNLLVTSQSRALGPCFFIIKRTVGFKLLKSLLIPTSYDSVTLKSPFLFPDQESFPN